MRVLVLVHETLVPPSGSVKSAELKQAYWKTEYDVVQALKELGHDTHVLGVGSELHTVRESVAHFRPHIVFNLLEEFAGEAVFDQNVVSYLELLGVHYTGCGPRGMLLARDKALAKKIFTYHRISTPRFHVFRNNRRIKKPPQLEYPLFVKTLNEEASLGISQNSIVHSDEKLIERVEYLQDRFVTDVIVEEYVEGRELYVALMGNERIKTFPIWELHFGEVFRGGAKIATRKAKWDLDYRKKNDIEIGPASAISEEVASKIYKICRRVYKVLELVGYARIDLRLDNRGRIYVIEANPNPDIGIGDEFAEAARAAGIEYPQLISKLLRLGISR